jgi:hypothetical protein
MSSACSVAGNARSSTTIFPASPRGPGGRLLCDPRGGVRTRILATFDRAYHDVLRLDPALCNDAVVVFRHQMSNWRSHANHTNKSPHEEQTSYFQKWSVVYASFADNFS